MDKYTNTHIRKVTVITSRNVNFNFKSNTGSTQKIVAVEKMKIPSLLIVLIPPSVMRPKCNVNNTAFTLMESNEVKK